MYGKYCGQPTSNPVMSVSISDTDSPYNAPYFAEQVFTDSSAAAVEVRLLPCTPTSGQPTTSGRVGRTITISDVGGAAGAHSITVTPNGVDNISGAANYVINTNYGSVTLRQNATGWFIVAKVV